MLQVQSGAKQMQTAFLEQRVKRVVMIGFGSIGQGLLPLLYRHLPLADGALTIITARLENASYAEKYGARLRQITLTADNYEQHLSPLLAPGDFLLNLAVDVSSYALIRLCQDLGVLYLDTCIEPWAGGYHDQSLSSGERSNFSLRQKVLALRPHTTTAPQTLAQTPAHMTPGQEEELQQGPIIETKAGKDRPTAIVTHGANPGLVSHFVKQALRQIAQDVGLDHSSPQYRHDWAHLAACLNIKVIQIAERDWQISHLPKRLGEFVNSWSVSGFVGEGLQPAELGWGTHERHWPARAQRHHEQGAAAIYLEQAGAATRVRSWTPKGGAYGGFLITHGEAISLADYLTLGPPTQPSYRPTVYYAYHPCHDAILSLHELAGRNWQVPTSTRILGADIISGEDELGVLLLGHPKGAYWYGSHLSIEAARQLAPYNNATTLQVTAGIIAAMIWAYKHPSAGIVEPEELDYEEILAFAAPYLGELKGHWGDWHPLQNHVDLFTHDYDLQDMWQFKNFLIP
jgi:homospermidine synthase